MDHCCLVWTATSMVWTTLQIDLKKKHTSILPSILRALSCQIISDPLKYSDLWYAELNFVVQSLYSYIYLMSWLLTTVCQYNIYSASRNKQVCVFSPAEWFKGINMYVFSLLLNVMLQSKFSLCPTGLIVIRGFNSIKQRPLQNLLIYFTWNQNIYILIYEQFMRDWLRYLF